MKKLIITVCCMLGVIISAGAQEEQTEQTPANTRPDYLPVAGDFALGIDAMPFFTYFGNMFNGNLNNNSPFAEGYKGGIYGKYFLEDNRAIRVKLNIDIYSKTQSATVTNDTEAALNPLNFDATVIDNRKNSMQSFGLLVGYELRRGKGRIQGFYGGEVGLGYSSGESSKYEYGNPMTALNQTPTTSNWTGGTTTPASRPTEVTLGSSFSAILAGFVGVEYFIAPQLSIGAEFNLALSFDRSGQGEETYETFNAAANKVITQSRRKIDPETSSSPNYSSEFNVKTIPTGSIFLMFHF